MTLCIAKTTFITSTPDAAAAPPLNVQATQSSASAPVEVRWSPPSSGATNITGYRVFYNGQDAIFLPATINGVLIERDNLGQEISIRSESSSTSQLPSELISATLTISSEDLLIPYLI